jgi:hypothetical protein
MVEEENLTKEAQRISPLVRKRQSPKGSLNLPEKLDERRLKYAIPDGAFHFKAMFDRITCFQLIDRHHDGAKFGDTMIWMPESSQTKAKNEAPRALLLDAGAQAMDVLASNGMALGDIIYFWRLAPYRIVIDVIGGHDFHVILLRCGDILGCEDTRTAMNEDLCSMETVVDEETGSVQHVFKDKDGKIWNPTEPWISDDY